MIRSYATPLAAAKWVTIASAIVTLGCDPRRLEQQIEPLPQAMVYPPENWNTPLPPGVSSDPSTFRESLNRQEPRGVLHNRLRAATCPGCTIGMCARCTVRVTIQAITNTRLIDPDEPPVPGRAVAHIQNLDATKTEAYYGFRPRAQADYYFWVDRRPDADSARITVIEVPTAGGSVRAGRQKNLMLCHRHPPGYSGGPDADFLEYRPEGPCTASHVASRPGFSEASFFPALPIGGIAKRLAAMIELTAVASQGGWIDCNSGCCT
jgi:hypothetical protein